jgi:hypothetical protein
VRLFVLITSLAVVLAACDPCAGVIGCADGKYLAASGQIVDAVTGVGLDGVRIDVIRTGGIEVVADSVATTSAGGGFWRVELAPRSSGSLTADVKVSAPGFPPYRLHGVELDTHEHRGDANLNERWVPFLYFDFVAEFALRSNLDARPEGMPVEFRRTGGIALRGPGQENGVYRAPTNAAGRIHLYPTTGDSAVFAAEDGTLTGNLVAYLTPTDSTIIAGVVIWPSHTFRDRRVYPPVILNAVGH